MRSVCQKKKILLGVRVVTCAQNANYKLLSGPLFLPAVGKMSWEKNPKKKSMFLINFCFLFCF